MENYPVAISKDKEIHHFEVGEYPHHDEDRYKFKVLERGLYGASFQVDAQGFLHICQNPGGLNEETSLACRPDRSTPS